MAGSLGSKRKVKQYTESSRYKERTTWFFERAAFPLRDAPAVELEGFWASQVLDAAPDHQWEEAGPFNVAGRATSLVIHPTKPEMLFAGAAGGGVWMSKNAGEEWEPRWGAFISQNIGALAIRSIMGGRIELIAATGEANSQPDSYPGNGVFMSLDEGLSWSPFLRNQTAKPLDVEDDVNTFPRRIGVIAYNHFGDFAIGSITHNERLPAGLYFNEWQRGLRPCTFWGRRSYGCRSILYHPENRKRIYATIELRGPGNGIWRSDDGGRSWDQLTKGLLPSHRFGRTTLAFAPSDPDVIYALAADRATGGLLSMFRTRNGGGKWEDVTRVGFSDEKAMYYNNTLAVHPTDPDTVIWGGAMLYRTRNGGRNWKQITTSARDQPNTLHPDQHQLVWPTGDLIYTANDGGVFMSDDGGDSWHSRSKRMVTTQFYSLAVAPMKSHIFGGGAQDNGTLLTGIGGTKGEFKHVLPGDGGWLAFDNDDEEIVYGTAQRFMVYRHKTGRPWTLRNWANVHPEIDSTEKAIRTFPVLTIQPVRGKRIKPVWIGTHRLWVTRNGGEYWKAASHNFDGTSISAIAFSPVNPSWIFVGTTKGGIFRSTNGGKSWSQNLASTDIPRRMVTRIAPHPKQRRTVVVAVASTGVHAAVLQPAERANDSQDCFGHVFLSKDGGDTWADLDKDRLPEVVYNAVVYESRAPYRLFAGGDAGVFVYQGKEGSQEWIPLNGNLPNVVVSDLDYHARDNVLTAATYGRGIWRLPVNGPFSKPMPVDCEELPGVAGRRHDPTLHPPELISPDEDALLKTFPRRVTFKWTEVVGAEGYTVQVEGTAHGKTATVFAGSPTNEFTHAFLIAFGIVRGGVTGRWRVITLGEGSRRSTPSAWRTFRFAK